MNIKNFSDSLIEEYVDESVESTNDSTLEKAITDINSAIEKIISRADTTDPAKKELVNKVQKEKQTLDTSAKNITSALGVLYTLEDSSNK